MKLNGLGDIWTDLAILSGDMAAVPIDYETNTEMWGTYTAPTSTAYNFNPDPGLSDDPSSQAAQTYAQTALIESASSGKPVSSVAQSIITQSGFDLNSILTAGGAIFKMVTNSSGQRVAQPVNAAAQAKVASAASSNKMMLYAGLGLLAFAFLRKG